MKQINIKVYPNGMTSCNPLVMNFDRENNTTEIIVDYSEVDYLDWTKQLDLVFADGTHTYIEGTSNTLTVPLLEEYLKQGIISLQPLAKRLVVDEYEKVKWQIANVTVRESLNVLENDTSITPSIAEQWEIRIQAVEDAEVIRQSNEGTRVTNENTRISNENTRISQESSRVNAESTRISNEQGRVSEENIRVSSESTRSSNETTRLSNEATRVSSESTRQSNESLRVSSENTRLLNENTRVSNENTRISNENARNVFVAYNGSTSYVVGNKVFYNGASYRCKLNSVGNLPTNTTYWDLIAGVITDALNVANTPSGNISSTTVQGAINELDTEKADKLFATNLVTNGDFSNGTTGWIGTFSTISATANTLSIVGNGGNSLVRVNQTTTITYVPNKKIYVRSRIRVTNALCITLAIRLYGSTTAGTIVSIIQTSPILNTWYNLSSVLTLPTDGSGNIILQEYHQYANTTDATNAVMEVQYVQALDLTAIFGAGKEPTKEQMDWLLAQKYTNSWFDGTKELTSITDLLTLLNTKANITQEAWITPTLLNGWVLFATDYYTPQYMKDQLGFVHLRGMIKSGTSGSFMFSLPSGYRPIKKLIFPSPSNYNYGNIAIDTLGNVSNVGGNTNWFSLEGISFKAEQ